MSFFGLMLYLCIFHTQNLCRFSKVGGLGNGGCGPSIITPLCHSWGFLLHRLLQHLEQLLFLLLSPWCLQGCFSHWFWSRFSLTSIFSPSWTMFSQQWHLFCSCPVAHPLWIWLCSEEGSSWTSLTDVTPADLLLPTPCHRHPTLQYIPLFLHFQVFQCWLPHFKSHIYLQSINNLI